MSRTVKFYIEVEIPNELEDVKNIFGFVKYKSKYDTIIHNDTPIKFTGKVKDQEGYFVTKDSPYLLGGPTEGHDACCANTPGVANMCCGHGVDKAYIQFEGDLPEEYKK